MHRYSVDNVPFKTLQVVSTLVMMDPSLLICPYIEANRHTSMFNCHDDPATIT